MQISVVCENELERKLNELSSVECCCQSIKVCGNLFKYLFTFRHVHALHASRSMFHTQNNLNLECVFVNTGLFVGVKVIYTSRSAPWGNFTPFIAYVTLLVSLIPFSDCPVKATETKSPFITLGNSDVRPDSELGSHPIQLEHINEKCCTNHPWKYKRHRSWYLEHNFLSCLVGRFWRKSFKLRPS